MLKWIKIRLNILKMPSFIENNSLYRTSPVINIFCRYCDNITTINYGKNVAFCLNFVNIIHFVAKFIIQKLNLIFVNYYEKHIWESHIYLVSTKIKKMIYLLNNF